MNKSRAITPVERAVNHFVLETETEEAVRASYVPNTLRTRISQLRSVERFAQEKGFAWSVLGNEPLPEKALELMLNEIFRNGGSLKTIDARVDAVRWWSEENNLPSPTTHPKLVRARKGWGLKRAKENQAGKNKIEVAHAIGKDVLLEVVSKIPDTLKGKRDKAIILLGWCGAFRRSELAGLSVENVEAFENTESGLVGITCQVFNTKTKKDGSVDKIIQRMGNPKLCPVRAYYAWLEASKVTTGNVFRSVTKGGEVGERLSCHSVNAIVKKYFPEDVFGGNTEGQPEVQQRKRKKITAHSLRAGYATASVLDKIPPSEARAQGGWSATSGIFDSYATRAKVGLVARVPTW